MAGTESPAMAPDSAVRPCFGVDDGNCKPLIVAMGRSSAADKTMVELSASRQTYSLPVGEITNSRMADGKWGKKFLRPVSSCQKTRTDSLPPEMI